MSQFYGDLQGQARTKATRRGNKKNRTGGSNSSYNKECIAVVEEV